MRQAVGALVIALLVASAAGGSAGGAQSADPSAAEIADRQQRGQALLERLTLDPASDAAVFAALPAGEPERLLTAVAVQPQAYASDPARWPAMHRAIAALVELSFYRHQEFKAAVYESLQATLYHSYEQNDEAALAAAQRALTVAERYAPPESVASYVSTVGQHLHWVGRNREALVYLDRARREERDRYGSSAAYTWRTIVLAMLAEGDAVKARRDADRFVALADDAGATPVFRGTAYLAVADVQIETGDYDGMVRSVQQAMAAAGTDPNAEIVGYTAVSQLMQGVLAASVTLPYDDALALARRIGREVPALPISIEAFADNAVKKRRRAAGDLDAMLRADNTEVTEARDHGDPLAIAEALLAESLDYAWLNASRQSIALLEEASRLLANELAHPTFPGSEGTVHLRLMVLTNLGLAYADTNELALARATFDEMTRVVDALPPGIVRQQMESSRVQAMVGLARVSELQDDPEASSALLKQALPLVQGKGGPSRSEILAALARVSAAADAAPSDVATFYMQAIAAAASERDRDFETTTRLAYARFLATEPGRQLPDAEGEAGRQLAVAEQQANELRLAGASWKAEFGFGLLDEGAGRLGDAIARYEQAVRAFEALRASLTVDEHRQALVDDKAVQELYQRLVALLARTGRAQAAWEYLERDKARSFAEMMRGRSDAPGTPVPASIRDLEQRILRLKLSLLPENAGLLRASGREPGAAASELRSLLAEHELKVQETKLADTRATRTGGPPRLADLQARIGPRAAIVEYALLPGSVEIFVVTRTALSHATAPVDGARLRRDLLALRRALPEPGRAEETDRLIASVSAALVHPVESMIDGKARLIVVPAGAMNYVPFQVLRTADGSFIVDRFSVTTVPSASTIPVLRSTAPGNDRMFVGALGEASAPGWPPLPGTAREARALGQMFPRARIAVDRQFTATRVIDALRHDDTVHLATHGDLDDQAPLFSAIVTAPSGQDAGRVSMRDLMNTPIGADLVVLSACQTAAGTLLGGDEVSSLTRTMLISGANAVVSSLWNVDDDATVELMRGFYAAVKQHRPIGDALRAAELGVRRTHPEPAYWAPFVATAIE